MTNKRPYLNPNLDSTDDEEVTSDYKRTKLDEEDEEIELDDDVVYDTDDVDMSTETTDDNIIDPDYVPSADETDTEDPLNSKDEDKDNVKDPLEESSNSSSASSEDKSKVFADRLDELKAKGISLHKAGDESSNLTLTKASSSTTSVNANTANNNQPSDPKTVAFAKSIINFPHEKKCIRRCRLLENEEIIDSLSSLTDASVCSTDFVKSSVSLVTCSIRLGDINMSRKILTVVFNLGKIQGMSPLSQALIGGVKSQTTNIDNIENWENKALEAFKDKQFSNAAGYVGKALKIASSCIRLKQAQADALCFAERFSEGDKVAQSILDQDKTNVAALFLRAHCQYQMKELDKAIPFYQQTLNQRPDHQPAKTYISRVRLLKERRDNAVKAAAKNKLDDAVNMFSLSIEVDPSNKNMQSHLLAERGLIYLKQKKHDLALRDCEASLRANSSCTEATVLKGKCFYETEQWGEALGIFENLNTTDSQAQRKMKQEAETAARSKNFVEAQRLYHECVKIDRRNAQYRQQLRDAKQKHHLSSRLDYYALLQVEKTVGETELRKAYFKRSREFHPDKHANANEEEREEFNKKFQQAKEAYETLSDNEKRKVYDRGTVNPPPGGWYRDVDKRFLTTLKRMSESNFVTMPTIPKIGNIDIRSAGSNNRGRSQPTRGRSARPTTSFRGTSSSSSGANLKTGPGITINKVPTTRGRGRNRGK